MSLRYQNWFVLGLTSETADLLLAFPAAVVAALLPLRKNSFAKGKRKRADQRAQIFFSPEGTSSGMTRKHPRRGSASFSAWRSPRASSPASLEAAGAHGLLAKMDWDGAKKASGRRQPRSIHGKGAPSATHNRSEPKGPVHVIPLDPRMAGFGLCAPRRQEFRRCCL